MNSLYDASSLKQTFHPRNGLFKSAMRLDSDYNILFFNDMRGPDPVSIVILEGHMIFIQRKHILYIIKTKFKQI